MKRKDAQTMTTQTRPRQLPRDAFIARCRELIDSGLDYATIIERMDPVRSMSVTEQFMRDAVKDIAEALEIAAEVSAPKLTQARRDFVNFAEHAAEQDHAYHTAVLHIHAMHPAKDVGIIASKLKLAKAEQERHRALADEAAEAWQALQLKRAAFDSAARAYPGAFSDEERQAWEPNK
jgi:hypothetical protein